MSANAIHDSFKQIAERYSIPEDQISRILESIKIKSSAKPSSEQIRGFEKVCQMVQSGMELEVAVQTIHEEAKNSNKVQKENSEAAPAVRDRAEDEVEAEINSFILEQAERAAEAIVAKLPTMAIKQQQRCEETFNQGFRQYLAKLLQDPIVKQQFQAAIEGRDMGNLPTLSERQTSNILLPSSSSSSS